MDINAYQQKHYENVWSGIQPGNKPGKSGWKTAVPAPDFVNFVSYLKDNYISGKALDLGCGAGRHSILLAQNGFEVSGIDFAKAAIIQAESNARQMRVDEQTKFVVGNVLDLPYPDNYFNVINDDGCLHHINPAQWSTYLFNVVRVIDIDGILRIKVFSKNCVYFEENTGPDSSQWLRLDSSGYTYFFSEADIRHLFHTHFDIISLSEESHTETKEKRFFFILLKPKILHDHLL